MMRDFTKGKGDPYENLATAIVAQAVDDYISARTVIRDTPRYIKREEEFRDSIRKQESDPEKLKELINKSWDKESFYMRMEERARFEIDRCKTFFKSQWCECLTDVNGDYLLQAADERFESDYARKHPDGY